MATIDLFTGRISSGQPFCLSKTERAKVHEGLAGIRRVAIKEVIGCTQEIDLMAIRNRNIVQFYSHSGRIQVMDLADNGNLANNINKIKTMGYQKEEIAKQISMGLLYLQNINIVHKKIRPSNILLDRNFDAKIAGFGSESNDLDSNRHWMAPELLSDPPSPFSFRTDIYALGMIMKEMGKGSEGYMQWMVRCQDKVPEQRPLKCPISDEPTKVKERPDLGSTTKEEKLQEIKDIALEETSGYVANRLGDMYRAGDEATRDSDEALKWYMFAANLGFPEAQCTIGNHYHDMGDHAIARSWYLKSAKQGHQGACQKLGDLLFAQCRYEEAKEWYLEAASSDDPYAQSWVGETYYQMGTLQDDLHAFEWFYKAAVQGLPVAEYSLGYMYTHGRGTAVNYEEAEKWLLKAKKNGYIDAERELETLHEIKREHDWNRVVRPDEFSPDELEDINRRLGFSHTSVDQHEFYQRFVEEFMKEVMDVWKK